MTAAELRERIEAAAARRAPLCLRGGGSKDFYGGPLRGEPLEVGAHRGITSYEPTELVVTARGGTPLAELEATLGEKGQMLAFEPPHFGPGATLAGCIAAGLSGPRRAAAGAVRDHVLGARILDGRARELAFGGKVMKNVAGYDVSRLLAGSLGTLGVILEASLKVLPRPPAETTLRFEMAQAPALEQVNRWAAAPLPVSATCWRGGELRVRLSGAAAAVRGASAKLGGEAAAVADAARFWSGVREQADAFFADATPLWRLSVPAAAPEIDLPGRQLIEWGGALRWLKTGADAAAHLCGGSATLFRASDKTAGAFAPLEPALARLHREVKQAFDPAGILNPGRLYPEL